GDCLGLFAPFTLRARFVFRSRLLSRGFGSCACGDGRLLSHSPLIRVRPPRNDRIGSVRRQNNFAWLMDVWKKRDLLQCRHECTFSIQLDGNRSSAPMRIRLLIICPNGTVANKTVSVTFGKAESTSQSTCG